MSRNSNRRKTSDTDTRPPPADPVLTNNNTNSLTFAAPTEFVDLPSGGEFYADGHPLQGVSSIEIKYMTAKEEDILTSQTLLKKGLAIERLLGSVLIDKTINPMNMLVGDRNAVLVAIRITGYGEEYAVSVPCPSCSTSVENEFDLSLCKAKEKTDHELELTEEGNYIINLPISKYEIEVKMLTGKDEKYLLELSERKKKKNLQETTLTDQLNRIIVSVNGVTEPAQIRESVDNMPARDSRFLRRAYDKIVPNVDMRQEFNCSNCGHSTDVEVPFTTAFFWPK